MSGRTCACVRSALGASVLRWYWQSLLLLVLGPAGPAGSFLLHLASYLLDSIHQIHRLELVGGFLLACLSHLGACRCYRVAALAGGPLFAASICTLQRWESLGDVALVCFE